MLTREKNKENPDKRSEYELGPGSRITSSWDTETVKLDHSKDHSLSVSCPGEWEGEQGILDTKEYNVGASYLIFLTGNKVTKGKIVKMRAFIIEYPSLELMFDAGG